MSCAWFETDTCIALNNASSEYLVAFKDRVVAEQDLAIS